MYTQNSPMSSLGKSKTNRISYISTKEGVNIFLIVSNSTNNCTANWTEGVNPTYNEIQYCNYIYELCMKLLRYNTVIEMVERYTSTVLISKYYQTVLCLFAEISFFYHNTVSYFLQQVKYH